MNEYLTLNKADGIATLTMLKPTMPPGFFGAIEQAFQSLAQDRDLRVVLIQSSAKSFSYGLDLPAAMGDLGPHLAGGTASQRLELLYMIRRLQGAFNEIERCPVPVISAVHGHCIGGGVDLIAACDIRLSSRDALYSVRETKIAIVADLGSLQRLPRIIGQGHTRELAFTGKDIGAERALQIGLVNELFDSKEALWEGAQKLAGDIAKNPGLTVRGVKAVLDYGMDKSARDGLEYVAAWNASFLASEDLGEAMAAFMERRPPQYKGK